ncbi:hypothetical protein CHH28_17440 [Bacterioplanes sanyensis]|uniref:DUF2523 domain-containing protein n=1 Tax=Bacterioplanes sanyensis TaxID=1249553 RepID=A0A222FNH8_9GAMM|nr:DUF2523 family protein [Bacterioplanes sanyensis]ASP40350.1 hypothetical protein CHH28_17440 [Bacterioplanes sanyensis]
MKLFLTLFFVFFSVSTLADDSGSAVEALSLYESVFSTDSYTWIDTFFERVAAWLVLWWLEIKLWTIAFGYDIAKELIEQLGIVQQLESSIAALNNQTFRLLAYLNIFEGINIIMSSYATRMILGLM